ncbi:alpha/beta hydrolase [Aquibacillus sp. 3ASR75-11]|uniref:Alpha/beta hydrolase n=1 Tax=Terrihalobacillus insolitus TaxID=2950438 RepID=A0A9X3WRW6_9BACI|nr:alpha/beta hydrolase [Terrihalobacillus insolitus]MDC3412974.1 alpha/beta hydrolase [Terrihalobacillus insolitus]MDC3424727.1 alpha/beta hydrolase [Terrihalobacillus insolitus]
MHHFFQKGSDSNAPTLVILHGTGGTERDLLPVAQMIDPNASVLGVRGNVMENGMPRFFKRLREGVFDEQDLIERTEELHHFLDEAADNFGFDRQHVIGIGFSNGANIAGSLLFHYASSLEHAILFHPMVPIRNKKLPDLNSHHVFIGAGTNDPLIQPEETEALVELLTNAGADVTTHWENNGHQLTREEVLKAKEWYNQHINIK